MPVSSPRLAAVALSTLLSAPALAAPPAARGDVEPGTNWESTVEMEMAGMAMKMPPQTHKFCKPKKDWAEPPGPGGDGNCKTTEMKRSGNRMTWKVTCTGQNPMTGEGEMTYTATTYAGAMKMQMQQGEVTMRMKGRELGGDCDANEMKRKAAAMKAEAEARQVEGERMQAAQMAKACDDAVQKMTTMAFNGIAAYCKEPAQKSAFCSRMSTREGYLALKRNNPDAQRQSAAQGCNQDLGAIQSRLCGEARRDAMKVGASMSFLVQECPAEAQALARTECPGLDYTSATAAQTKLCTAYAQEALDSNSSKKRKGSGGQGSAQPSDPPPSTDDAVKKAARGLLPFGR